jgi:hypothetical protein
VTAKPHHRTTDVNEGGCLADTKITFTSHITLDLFRNIQLHDTHLPSCPTGTAMPYGIQIKQKRLQFQRVIP